MRCFLSHNKADKPVARKIGAHLTIEGMDVWFDEWEIQAGDSIPGKLNTALEAFDAFILVWSTHADRSNWVRQELNSAIMRSIQDKSAKIVPCFLDATPLPALIADRRGIDFSDEREGVLALVGELTGSRARRDRLLAIQAALEDLDVDWIIHPMVPPMVCCPRCGEEKLDGYHENSQDNALPTSRRADFKAYQSVLIEAGLERHILSSKVLTLTQSLGTSEIALLSNPQRRSPWH